MLVNHNRGCLMYLLKTDAWYLERLLYLMGGTMTLISVVLVLLHSVYWLILTAFVGLNLVVLGLTGFCPSAVILVKLGVNSRLSRPGK
jgi:hypothetical protein